jgi:hypothetical protein
MTKIINKNITKFFIRIWTVGNLLLAHQVHHPCLKKYKKETKKPLIILSISQFFKDPSLNQFTSLLLSPFLPFLKKFNPCSQKCNNKKLRVKSTKKSTRKINLCKMQKRKSISNTKIDFPELLFAT